jgi:hypothetical protein
MKAIVVGLSGGQVGPCSRQLLIEGADLLLVGHRFRLGSGKLLTELGVQAVEMEGAGLAVSGGGLEAFDLFSRFAELLLQG